MYVTAYSKLKYTQNHEAHAVIRKRRQESCRYEKDTLDSSKVR